MTGLSGDVLAFLGFELDPAAAELKKAGQRIEVEPQVFDVIAYLAAHSGRVVTRDELIEAVWQGRAVTDSTISTRINAARRALGDDGRTQAVIKTIHGRGFRFEVQPQARPADTGDGGAGGGHGPSIQVNRDGLAWPDKPSVAVLPFDVRSRDENHEFFADGVTEDVIIGLSRLHALFVIGMNSSFSYKNQPQDTATISQELGVKYLVVGGVRFSQDRLRVSAQLVDCSVGCHVWTAPIWQG